MIIDHSSPDFDEKRDDRRVFVDGVEIPAVFYVDTERKIVQTVHQKWAGEKGSIVEGVITLEPFPPEAKPHLYDDEVIGAPPEVP